MLKTTFTLTHKRPLTHDVYELTYRCPDLPQEPPKPGQYVMFQLAPGLNRSYSMSHTDGENFTLIVKRIANGRGSPMICDAEIGSTFAGMLPLGHFTLRDTAKNKCFIGTGTGFAPLYCQIGETIRKKLAEKIAFIFGVRNHADSFYDEEIRALLAAHAGAEFFPYFSREAESEYHGYVTDWITAEHIAEYEEFYICGSPAMVRDAREKLASLGVSGEQIFWEQY